MALIDYASSGGRSSSGLLRALAESKQHRAEASRARRAAPFPGGRDGNSSAHDYSGPAAHPNGNFLQLPTDFKSTHMTSGLGWPAEDIMASAGTVVGAPEAGRVVYWHPEGAQGGGSIMFDPDAPGPNYWLGHLDAGAKPGHYRRGQRIALVSSRHPRPHVHEARDW